MYLAQIIVRCLLNSLYTCKTLHQKIFTKTRNTVLSNNIVKDRLSTHLSFTLSFIKRILLAGPERASRNLERVVQKHFRPTPSRHPLKRSSKTQLSITSKDRNILTQNVHNIPPYRKITGQVNLFTRSQKVHLSKT